MTTKVQVQKCDLCGERLKLRTVGYGPHEGVEYFICPNNKPEKPTEAPKCPMSSSFRGNWKAQPHNYRQLDASQLQPV